MDKIKVAVRVRPFTKRELELGAIKCVKIIDNQIVLSTTPTKDGLASFKFMPS
jgi:hypothetical protein